MSTPITLNDGREEEKPVVIDLNDGSRIRAGAYGGILRQSGDDPDWYLLSSTGETAVWETLTELQAQNAASFVQHAKDALEITELKQRVAELAAQPRLIQGNVPMNWEVDDSALEYFSLDEESSNAE